MGHLRDQVNNYVQQLNLQNSVPDPLNEVHMNGPNGGLRQAKCEAKSKLALSHLACITLHSRNISKSATADFELTLSYRGNNLNGRDYSFLECMYNMKSALNKMQNF